MSQFFLLHPDVVPAFGDERIQFVGGVWLLAQPPADILALVLVMVGGDVGAAAVGVYAELLHQGKVAQYPGIVERLLPRLNLLRIEIVLLVVAEAPATAHVRVAVLQPGEVFPAYPPLLAAEPARHAVAEELQSLPVEVVSVVAGELSTEHHPVGHGASSGEEVVEVLHALGGDGPHEVVRNQVLASLVRNAIAHTLPVLSLFTPVAPFASLIVSNGKRLADTSGVSPPSTSGRFSLRRISLAVTAPISSICL